jgi:hypothetical protein
VTNSGQAIAGEDQLEIVLEDGILRREQTLGEIRGIAASYDNFSSK